MTDASNISGIELINADNFETWYLAVEVLGDTVYEVRHSAASSLCATPYQACTLPSPYVGREVRTQIQVRRPVSNICARGPIRRRRHLPSPDPPGMSPGPTLSFPVSFCADYPMRTSLLYRQHVYSNGHVRTRLVARLTTSKKHALTRARFHADMRLHPRQRVVPGVERRLGLRDYPEHARFLQGVSLIHPHVCSLTRVSSIHSSGSRRRCRKSLPRAVVARARWALNCLSWFV